VTVIGHCRHHRRNNCYGREALSELKQAAAFAFRGHQDALDYTAHVREDVARWSISDRFDVANRNVNRNIGCDLRLHSGLSDEECDFLFVGVPSATSGRPSHTDDIASVKDAGLTNLDGDQGGMFLGVTESVQGPQGVIPSLVWLLPPKQRDDFRRAVYAYFPTINVVINSGRVVAERKVCPLRVRLPAGNGSGVTDLIQASSKIVGDVEEDTGKSVRQFLSELDLVDMLPRMRVLIDDVGVRVAIDKLVYNQFEVTDVVLCPNECQTRAVEQICHGKTRPNERPRISELMRLMRDANFLGVFVGIESPDPMTLTLMKKKQNTRRNIAESIRKIYSYGMFVNAGFILGFDSEKGAVADAIVELIQDAAIPLSIVGLLFALPGTQLTRRLEKEGRLHANHDVFRPGDQCTQGLNFETAWPLREILLDYKSILERIFDPAAYASASTV
jgi:Domain of unknown function (DUF4070)